MPKHVLPSTASRAAHRRRFILSQAEVDEGLQPVSPERGKFFRFFFLGLVVSLVLLLVFLKLNAESMQLSPRLKEKSIVGGQSVSLKSPSSNLDGGQKANEALDHYLSLLDKKREDSPPSQPSLDPSETDQIHETSKQRRIRERRERAEVMRAMKRAHDEKMAEQQALTHCGQSCQAKYGEITQAYDALRRQVHTELHSLIFDEEETTSQQQATLSSPDEKSSNLLDPHVLKDSYEKRRGEIIVDGDDEMTEEDKQLALQELKEAYDIVSNPQSRLYYVLYEEKPPASMSKVSSRDPGWAQHLILKTHFHRLVFAWLDYFENSSVDLVVILFVVFAIFLGPAIARIPETVAMAQRMINHWGQEAVMNERLRNKKISSG